MKKLKNSGKIHIYTGNGKGKTTAAFGLALRAAGAGFKVFIAQFIKTGKSSEVKLITKYLPNIEYKSYGRGRFIKTTPSQADINQAKNALNEIQNIIKKGKYDLVILDEIFPAIKCGLVQDKELKQLLMRNTQNIELVLTGRGASESLIQRADLVTEMKEIKHYYQKGIKARKGIEF